MTERAIYLSARDDRMVFVIPWRDFSLVGTTDTDFDGDPDRLWATRDEVTYLLGDGGPGAARSARRARQRGLHLRRACARSRSRRAGRASNVSREHKVVAEGPGGRFLSVTGTKLTCFRSLAEEVGDRVMQALGRQAPSPTARLTPGRHRRGRGRGRSARVTWTCRRRWRRAASAARRLQVLVDTYGQGYRRVLELAEEAARRDRAPLPVESGDRRAAPSRGQRRAGRLATGRAPAAHGHRAEPLPGSRLRRVDRRPAWPSSCGWSARRLDAELDAYRQHVARSQRFRVAGEIRAHLLRCAPSAGHSTYGKYASRPTGHRRSLACVGPARPRTPRT